VTHILEDGAVEPIDLTQARLTLALSAGGAGTWQWDPQSGHVHWDAALEVIHGLPAGQFGGTFEDWMALLHPDDHDHVIATLSGALEGGDLEFEHRVVRPDGQVRWLHCSGQVLAADGRVAGVLGVAVDLTERRAAEAERDKLLAAEQAARDRLAFLAQATALLSRSLNAQAAMTELAQLAVPRLGDWCVVDTVERGELQHAATAHRDPDKADLVRRWRNRGEPRLTHGADHVVRTGASKLLAEIDDAVLRTSTQDPANVELLAQLGFRSAMVVPLVARGTVLGALTLVHEADASRRHSCDDLALAEDLANRAGVALDNARLFQERATVANVLQQALLPPALPQVPGVDLAARHQPAAEMVIGGDFYDVFENGDGTWTVLMGDVCGKDTTAATLTALARHSARAAAVRDADPRSVVGVMNHAFRHQSSVEQFCTAVCARLRVGEGGASLDVAVAGHPSPLVLRADGTVESLDVGGQLIGLFDQVSHEPHTLHLGPAETLLLYTDGVTEARRGDELFTTERLTAAVMEHCELGPERVVDGVLKTVAAFDNGDRRDDVAMLAVRVPPG
jgi:PAS domain S-box-containing protein